MDGFEWDLGHPKADTIWDQDNISQLGLDFLRLVIANMQDQGVTVRFDTKHKNFRPNYQIKYQNGSHQLFDGMTHELMHPMARFDLSSFSTELEEQQIELVYTKLRPDLRSS